VNDVDDFKKRIKKTTNYSDSLINAAWPEWWSEDATGSPSAEAELRFSVARKLGLDPRSLQNADGPLLMWDDTAKYKRFNGNEAEHRAITSFGTSISRILSRGITIKHSLVGYSAAEIRKSILAEQSFVRLQDLIALLWSVGIPIIHLKVYPLAAKHMSAMAVSSKDGDFAVLMAKDAQYPAWAAFSIAHEIGHICLGHLKAGTSIIDMEDPLESNAPEDEEEIASDKFALELLTGDPNFEVVVQGDGNNAQELATQALTKAVESRIEPGTIALCYGYVTGKWGVVQNALKIIYVNPAPTWEFINQTAKTQLSWDDIGDDNASYLQAIMGAL